MKLLTLFASDLKIVQSLHQIRVEGEAFDDEAVKRLKNAISTDLGSILLEVVDIHFDSIPENMLAGTRTIVIGITLTKLQPYMAFTEIGKGIKMILDCIENLEKEYNE